MFVNTHWDKISSAVLSDPSVVPDPSYLLQRIENTPGPFALNSNVVVIPLECSKICVIQKGKNYFVEMEVWNDFHLRFGAFNIIHANEKVKAIFDDLDNWLFNLSMKY